MIQPQLRYFWDFNLIFVLKSFKLATTEAYRDKTFIQF